MSKYLDYNSQILKEFREEYKNFITEKIEYCHICGAELQKGAEICNHCGSAIFLTKEQLEEKRNAVQRANFENVYSSKLEQKKSKQTNKNILFTIIAWLCALGIPFIAIVIMAIFGIL